MKTSLPATEDWPPWHCWSLTPCKGGVNVIYWPWNKVLLILVMVQDHLCFRLFFWCILIVTHLTDEKTETIVSTFYKVTQIVRSKATFHLSYKQTKSCVFVRFWPYTKIFLWLLVIYQEFQKNSCLRNFFVSSLLISRSFLFFSTSL